MRCCLRIQLLRYKSSNAWSPFTDTEIVRHNLTNTKCYGGTYYKRSLPITFWDRVSSDSPKGVRHRKMTTWKVPGQNFNRFQRFAENRQNGNARKSMMKMQRCKECTSLQSTMQLYFSDVFKNTSQTDGPCCNEKRFAAVLITNRHPGRLKWLEFFFLIEFSIIRHILL